MADDIRSVQQNPHLSGNLAPIRSEDDFELRVRGRIPEGLEGALYRIGPNPQFDPTGPYHAFIGDGMVHGFYLKDGKARYSNRWVRTPRWTAENKAGRPLFGGLGVPSDPSVEGIPSGGANTNIISHAGQLMALQEQSEPFAMQGDLGSQGFMSTGGKFTAHPKHDPETGELVWFAYSATPEPLNAFVDYGVTDRTGKVLRRDRFQAPFASMIHDFIVTRTYVVFPILPLTGSLDRAKSGRPAYAWEPGKGAFLGVMKRNASVDAIRWVEIDPNYVFHPMNAYEEGGQIRVELMEYPEAPLFPRPDGTRTERTEARLTRWTIDPVGGSRAKREQIDDLHAEFPRFDERHAGLPYRHGWYAANIGHKSPLLFNAVVHIDLKTGKRAIRQLAPGDTVSEPVFAPRAADVPEGDGHVLAVVHRAAENRSDLLILHAQDIAGDPAAVIEVPRRVPAGFHGNWVAA